MEKGTDMGSDMVGMFAVSKAGHDKDTIYVIMEELPEYVFLSDGKLKKAEKPKKKNKKHIQVMKKGVDAGLKEKILNGQHIYNEEIRKAIASVCTAPRRIRGCEAEGKPSADAGAGRTDAELKQLRE